MSDNIRHLLTLFRTRPLKSGCHCLSNTMQIGYPSAGQSQVQSHPLVMGVCTRSADAHIRCISLHIMPATTCHKCTLAVQMHGLPFAASACNICMSLDSITAYVRNSTMAYATADERSMSSALHQLLNITNRGNLHLPDGSDYIQIATYSWCLRGTSIPHLVWLIHSHMCSLHLLEKRSNVTNCSC